MLGHGDGGSAVLPRFPRAVKTISLDLEQLSFRFLLAAHASMSAISVVHRLEFAARRAVLIFVTRRPRQINCLCYHCAYGLFCCL